MILNKLLRISVCSATHWRRCLFKKGGSSNTTLQKHSSKAALLRRSSNTALHKAPHLFSNLCLYSQKPLYKRPPVHHPKIPYCISFYMGMVQYHGEGARSNGLFEAFSRLRSWRRFTERSVVWSGGTNWAQQTQHNNLLGWCMWGITNPTFVYWDLETYMYILYMGMKIYVHYLPEN